MEEQISLAQERAQDYPNDLSLDGGKLYCKFCLKFVDTKASTITDHLQSQKHILKKYNSIGQQNLNQMSFQDMKSQLVEDFVMMSIKSDLSFEQMDKIKLLFFDKHFKASGNFPSGDSIRNYHLQQVWQKQHFKLIQLMPEQQIHIQIDGTKDLLGNNLINTIISTYPKKMVFLADSRIVPQENAESLIEILNQVVVKYVKSWNNVDSIATDSAKKNIKESLYSYIKQYYYQP